MSNARAVCGLPMIIHWLCMANSIAYNIVIDIFMLWLNGLARSCFCVLCLCVWAAAAHTTIGEMTNKWLYVPLTFINAARFWKGCFMIQFGHLCIFLLLFFFYLHTGYMDLGINDSTIHEIECIFAIYFFYLKVVSWNSQFYAMRRL